MLITDPVHKKSTPIELGSMAQNIQSPFTETSPVIQDIPSPILEPITVDQDFQCPIVEEEVIPSEGAQALGCSFEILELDISKGKCKLPESELVDVVLLSNKVFDLEQSSVEKDLIIGNGLTTLLFDLKQYLFQKLGDEFQPLSAEGENIIDSSSGPTNPASPSSSERATRPAPDANLDTFLSSGPASAQ
uniref:Uncharacterized protein n=1 Tax=Lactuca sativa TaxID=4236 RepID=A0A9R1UXU4_LACSA|nr:hypothetical protein LSAT_V11C700352750 [Lactuca sativa]